MEVLLTLRFGLAIKPVTYLYVKYPTLSNVPLDHLLPTLELWHTGATRQVIAQNWRISYPTLKARVRDTTASLVAVLDEVLYCLIFIPNYQIHWDSRFDYPVPLWGPLAGCTTLIDVTVIPIHGFPFVNAEIAKETGDPYRTFYSQKHQYHCWKFTGTN